MDTEAIEKPLHFVICRNVPEASPAKLIFVGIPNPKSRQDRYKRFVPNLSAIFIIPTLLEFSMICGKVNNP